MLSLKSNSYIHTKRHTGRHACILTKFWKTKLQLNETHESIMTEIISFLKECFRVIAFWPFYSSFPWNLLSHLLKQLKGYASGNERNVYITHNFFVDNLKLYARTTNNLKKLPDIVTTTFWKDTDMKFGVDKCAYIKINGRK